MSRMIEVPDELYDEVHRDAEVRGLSVVGWIASKLPDGAETSSSSAPPVQAEPAADSRGPTGTCTGEPADSLSGRQPARSMYDLLAGRIGRFDSGTGQPSSANIAEDFGRHLEEKQRKGRL